MADKAVEYIVRAQDDASSVLEGLTRSVLNLGKGFEGMASSAGPAGVFALVAGAAVSASTAIVEIGRSFGDAVSQLDRLSASTGISIDKLQAMQQVVKEGGGDAGSLGAAFERLNREIANNNPLLGKLGVSSRDTYDAFMQLAGVLSRSSDQAAKSRIAFELLGRGGVQMLADVDRMYAGTSSMLSTMRREGSLIEGEVAERGRRIDDQLDTFERRWGGMWQRLKAETLPAAEAIVSAMNGMLDLLNGDNLEFKSAQGQNVAAWADRVRRFQLGESVQGMSGARMMSAHGTPSASPEDALARLVRGLSEKKASSVDALSIANRGWFAGKAEVSPTDRHLAEITAQYDMAKQALKNMGKTMQEFEVPALRFTEAGLKAAERMRLIEDTLNSLSSSVQSDMSAISADVLAGTTTLRDAWHQLMQALLRDLTSSAADFGIGLLFDLIPIPGAGIVGGEVAKNMSMAPARGGDTYNISALSARDVLQELTSPTGSLRGANDYVRTVSRASRR